MSSMHRLAVIGLSLALCACTSAPSGGSDGGGVSVASCDTRATDASCTEIRGASAGLLATAMAGCTGTWSMAACPRAGSLGGCSSGGGAGYEQIGWYYAGGAVADAAALMTLCTMGTPPGTYVAP